MNNNIHPEIPTPQQQASAIWTEKLNGHIAGFESPVSGRSKATLARVIKAMQLGQFHIVKKQFDLLKKDTDSVAPVLVKREKLSHDPNYPTDETTIDGKTFYLPNAEQGTQLEQSWEKFEGLINQIG